MTRSAFRRIVVGIDGSDASLLTLAWAAARLPAGGIAYALHVAGRSSELSGMRSRLDEACQLADGRGDITVRPALRVGEPVEAILSFAAEQELDTVVVGPHGLGAAGRRSPFLGRVTRTLVHHSRLPIVVHHRAPGANEGPIVACVGYGPPADSAAEWAADHASVAKRPLVLLHAISHRPIYPLDSPVDMLGSYLGPGVGVDWARSALADLRQQILDRVGDLEVSIRVIRRSPVRAIADAGSGAGGADAAAMVVLGRDAGVGTNLPPSPRLYQIISRAECPTAVIPTCERAEDE